MREHRGQPGLDAVLAPHVVRALRLLPGWRPAQDEVPSRVAQQVRQVGGPAGELAHLGYAIDPGRVLGVLAQPDGHRGHVEGVLVPDLAGTGDAIGGPGTGGVAHVSFLTTESGRHFMRKPIGAQGHAGTYALTLRFSMAATMERTPGSVSTMNRVFWATCSFISERM